jgi:hypothetical protein
MGINLNVPGWQGVGEQRQAILTQHHLSDYFAQIELQRRLRLLLVNDGDI